MTQQALTGTHLGILALGLAGLLALAFASHRHGEHLLGRPPAPRWQLMAAAAGWALLALSLGWGMAAMGPGIGITLWLGWLGLAALAWVFTLPLWPWQPPLRQKPARRPAADMPAPSVAPPRIRRCLSAALLLATVAVFALCLMRAQR